MHRFSFIVALVALSSACASSKDDAGTSLPVAFREAQKLYDEEDYYGAQLELSKLAYSSRATEYEDDVQFLLGMSYFKSEQFLLAIDAFQTLLRNVPASPYAQDAYFQIAECYYKLSPVPQLDQDYTRRAIAQYQGYIDTYPTPDSASVAREIAEAQELLKTVQGTEKKSQVEDVIRRLQAKLKHLDRVRLADERIRICREKLAQKVFEAAEQYVQLQAYRAATMYYEEVLSKFGDTKYAEPALRGKIETLIIREKWDDAEYDINRYADAFPERKAFVEAARRKLKTAIETAQAQAKEQANAE
ncbi:MAG: outer membrane protein assembly factor BamD [Chloroherpetonaceae bacterium]|nr:outer membrane protein assembly factor BamD [Chloroherpetonaceae bacterium]MDW8438162.1 outer membrane protein assembly factor BamD [Chloroherpetonaceae bacterium]